MRRLLTLTATVTVLAMLTACGQQAGSLDDSSGGDQSPGGEQSPGGDEGSSEAPPTATMPAMTFRVTETADDSGTVVMEAEVELAEDGSWQRSGTESASGTLTEEQVVRISELVAAEDFPYDSDSDVGCPTVIPSYYWLLIVGDERASNGNGGCVGSESASEIVSIIKEAADVGPTLE